MKAKRKPDRRFVEAVLGKDTISRIYGAEIIGCTAMTITEARRHKKSDPRPEYAIYELVPVEAE